MPNAFSKETRQTATFSSSKHIVNSLEIIQEAVSRYDDIVLPSGFNLNGLVLIDLAVKAGYQGKILFVDTAYHFTETLQTRDNVAERYPELGLITLSANRPDDRLFRKIRTLAAPYAKFSRYNFTWKKKILAPFSAPVAATKARHA